MALLLVAVVAAGGCRAARMPAAQPRPETAAEAPGDPVLGSPEAVRTIVFFGDFQCPHTRRALTRARAVVAEQPDRVRLVFKSHVLAYHPDAELASVAALVAHSRGLFWAYVDLLLEDQAALDRASLVARASRLGLDPIWFDAALDDPRWLMRVRAETRLARRAGVHGSPAIFVDGVPATASEL